MKLFIYLFSLTLLLNCKSKSAVLASEEKQTEIKTNCPDDGVCKTEYILNSEIEIKTDEFGNTYTNIVKGDKTIFKFTFSRNIDKMAVDGHYIEEIYAEFDNSIKDISLKDKELEEVKLLFNRMCYCKGSAGFYPIENGTLNIQKTDSKTYNIQLDFKMNKVPQVITSINETLILD